MRYFTSDLHFGHANIIRYCQRPFGSVAHMDQSLVARWNEVVSPQDEVWVLGDVALGKFVESINHVAQLNGELHLVAGNHDRCWSHNRRRRPSDLDAYTEVGFVLEPEELTLSLGDNSVRVSHFPYSGDSHGEDRYKEMRPRDRGEWLLHGHVHDTWRVRGRQLNVGTDVWGYAPVSETTLLAVIARGPHEDDGTLRPPT